jgi:hypothetical protein
MVHVICDLCERRSKIICHFIAASFCSNGDFDICQSCFDAGKRCHEASHKLLYLVMRDQVMINHLTDDAYRPRGCSGCEWAREKKIDKGLEYQELQPVHEYQRFCSGNWM